MNELKREKHIYGASSYDDDVIMTREEEVKHA